MKTARKQQVVAGHQAKTRMKVLHVKRKAVRHMSTRVAVGLPARRRKKVVVVPSLEAQRRLEVEAVLAAMARINSEVIRETAAKPEVLLQARTETGREVIASQPSVISLLQVLQRPRIVVVRPVVRNTKAGAVHQVRAKMTRKSKALKGRNGVQGKIQRAVTKLVEAIHAVLLVLAVGHHLLASHAGKATRSRVASLLINAEICELQPDIVTVE